MDAILSLLGIDAIKLVFRLLGIVALTSAMAALVNILLSQLTQYLQAQVDVTVLDQPFPVIAMTQYMGVWEGLSYIIGAIITLVLFNIAKKLLVATL